MGPTPRGAFRVTGLAALQSSAVSILARAVSAPAVAADPAAWQFRAAPYLWGAGLDGDVKAGRLPATGVEASFSDLAGFLDLGLMGAFEARRGRWGFIVDAIYIDLSDTQPTPDAAFGDAQVDLTQQLFTLAGTYRVRAWSKTDLDVVAGARYLDLDTDLELTSGLAAGRQGSRNEDWVDGFAGVSVRCKLGAHWTASGYADIGAGGSDLSWQALAGAGYGFNERVALEFGYRYFSTDYEQDDFVYDMAMAGPYLGVAFSF